MRTENPKAHLAYILEALDTLNAYVVEAQQANHHVSLEVGEEAMIDHEDELARPVIRVQVGLGRGNARGIREVKCTLYSEFRSVGQARHVQRLPQREEEAVA